MRGTGAKSGIWRAEADVHQAGLSRPGIGASATDFLESEAQKRGCSHFMLETGYRQLEAIAFYERCGYSRRSPFGEYEADPNSVFLEKLLD
ncbi:GNAT family N-acetyltransferase [Pseudomonas yamanorum]|uniref:GNAT family N-acetyltransferase n=1 Tax=Pseudomonas yamanorum TaxID=515393 RepID=UPI003F751974